MKLLRIFITGINGNGGRTYQVELPTGKMVFFDSMPGDERLYEYHDYGRRTPEEVAQARAIAEKYVGTLPKEVQGRICFWEIDDILREMEQARHDNPQCDMAVRVCEAILAQAVGYKDRTAWNHCQYQD